jgi:PAS domain S-box-containing protein
MFGFKKKNQKKTGGANAVDDINNQQKRFELIVNNIEDGVCLIDAQGTIQFMSPSAQKITGWTTDDATGVNVKQVIQLVNAKNEAYSEEDNPLNKVFKLGKAMRDNSSFMVNKNKQQIAVSLSISPLNNEAGSSSGAVVVFRDVTQERAQEQQKNDFVSTASHEMRTPVAEIEGFLSLVLNEKVATIDERARNFITKAYGSSRHLGKLFQDLLASSRAEDGNMVSNPVVVEMGQLLEKTTEDLKMIAEKKGLFMDFVIGSSTVINATREGSQLIKPFYYVKADPDRLVEVVNNLYDNAVKYTEKGKIIIGLTGNDKVVQFYIKDTGMGIPKDDLAHLFQKFYIVDSTKTRSIGGSGLGLFICRKIIEMYNGRIWAESEVGKGTTFFINLPRLTTQQAQAMQSPATVKPAAKPANT